VQILKASHEKIKEFINNGDPFLEKKKLYNQKMLERYSYFSQEIKNSADPLKKAVILSIGGNIIDFLPKDNQNIDDKIENLLHRDLAIDDVSLLLEDLHNAASILYLTDNTGEIVLDKLLIETLIEHNVIDQHKITVATRGMPIINDATLEDAQEIGLTNIVNVINNGDNSPGTILATSSKEFQDYFYKADVVVAKGMGNFETLDEIKNKKLYCLFVSKCEYASKKLGVTMDDFICKKIG
jgi:uncharacterized protein with ATP-grasp and redox domains